MAVMMLAAFTIPAAADDIDRDVFDMESARKWCDGSMLSPIEGIWRYPADQTLLLIRQSKSESGRYDLIVVETPDTRLTPGDIIGYLKPSASASKYEMGVYGDKKGKIIPVAEKCVATYHPTESSLQIETPSLKASLRSTRFLPSLWRAIRITINDPVNKLPKGMVKIYPNPSLSRPDYL